MVLRQSAERRQLTAERWERAKELFEAALERPPKERSAFLSEAAGSDEDLRLEAGRLISEYERAGKSLESALPQTIDLYTFSPGDVLLGRFEVIRFVGRGGMGEVYEAEDLMLHERVALKTVRSEIAGDKSAVARFKREIQLAKKITHPNVCRIYDLHHLSEGRDGKGASITFLSMEFLLGPTLAERLRDRGRLTTNEAHPIAEQMAGALEAAHQAGITHRDFKPGNVMLVATGQGGVRAVVTDFGLARSTVASDTGLSVSQPGRVLGTLRYMAPEQLAGGEITSATDVYALGLVLYEMVTGKQPFQARSQLEAAARRLKEDPAPPRSYVPDLDQKWEAAILRCLKRDPAGRFPSAWEVALGLSQGTTSARRAKHRHVMAAMIAVIMMAILSILAFMTYQGRWGPPRIASIAVLPFANEGSDPGTEYLSEGITEGVVNDLSQLGKIRVIASGAVQRYRAPNVDPQSAGRELGVEAVLTGRVVSRGGLLRVHAELMNVADRSQLWGNQYNRRQVDIVKLQQEISHDISESLRLRLSGEHAKRLARRYSDNSEAYQLYLKGRFFWNKRTEESFSKAVDCFRRAIEKDRSYALAYAGLADCYALEGYGPSHTPREMMPKAKDAALRALDLDSSLPEAHASLGFEKALFEWDWPEAEQEYQRAIELNPVYATAHHWYAITVLTPLNRREEAIAEAHRALVLEPLSLIINTNSGATLYYARHFSEAIEQLQKTIELEPTFYWSYWTLGHAYAERAMLTEAIAVHEKAQYVLSAPTRNLAALAHSYAMAGRRDEAQKLLDELRLTARHSYVSAYDLAYLCVALGKNEAAFEWLQKAFEEHEPTLVNLNVDPKLVPIRSDPRFKDLVRRMRLNV